MTIDEVKNLRAALKRAIAYIRNDHAARFDRENGAHAIAVALEMVLEKKP